MRSALGRCLRIKQLTNSAFSRAAVVPADSLLNCAAGQSKTNNTVRQGSEKLGNEKSDKKKRKIFIMLADYLKKTVHGVCINKHIHYKLYISFISHGKNDFVKIFNNIFYIQLDRIKLLKSHRLLNRITSLKNSITLYLHTFLRII